MLIPQILRCTSRRNHLPMKSTLQLLGSLGCGTEHHTGLTGPAKLTGDTWHSPGLGQQ